VLPKKLNKESEAWARAFALDLEVVQDAFGGFLQVITDRGDEEATDAEAAKALAQMRKDLHKTIKNHDAAGMRADHLDEVAARLERSIQHTEVLEAAGLLDELPDLKPRLLATRSLISALRAAIARRGR